MPHYTRVASLSFTHTLPQNLDFWHGLVFDAENIEIANDGLRGHIFSKHREPKVV